MATTKPTAGANQWDKKELGVLWKKESKASGQKYLTGTINLKELGFDEDVPVIVFSNKNKQKDTHPDLRIYLSEKRDKPATAAPTAATKPTRATPAPAPVEDQELI